MKNFTSNRYIGLVVHAFHKQLFTYLGMFQGHQVELSVAAAAAFAACSALSLAAAALALAKYSSLLSMLKWNSSI